MNNYTNEVVYGEKIYSGLSLREIPDLFVVKFHTKLIPTATTIQNYIQKL